MAQIWDVPVGRVIITVAVIYGGLAVCSRPACKTRSEFVSLRAGTDVPPDLGARRLNRIMKLEKIRFCSLGRMTSEISLQVFLSDLGHVLLIFQTTVTK